MEPSELAQILQGMRSLYAQQREQHAEMMASLGRIEMLLQQNQGEPKPPSLEYELTDYPDFDWSRINAEVAVRDADGVAAVRWNGRIYKRRSPDNRFEPVVYFSRCVGKDDDGSNRYERLITFKKSETPEPIGRKALAQLER